VNLIILKEEKKNQNILTLKKITKIIKTKQSKTKQTNKERKKERNKQTTK